MDPLILAITCIVVYIPYIPYIPDAYTPAYLHIHVHVTHSCIYTAYSLRVVEEVVTYVLHLFRLCPIASILFFSYIILA